MNAVAVDDAVGLDTAVCTGLYPLPFADTSKIMSSVLYVPPLWKVIFLLSPTFTDKFTVAIIKYSLCKLFMEFIIYKNNKNGGR